MQLVSILSVDISTNSLSSTVAHSLAITQPLQILADYIVELGGLFHLSVERHACGLPVRCTQTGER